MSTEKKGKSLYSQRSSNVRKTWLLMATFVAIFSVIGLVLSYYYESKSILFIALIFAIVANIFSYWFSDKMVLKMSGAKEISKNDYPEFWNITENLTIATGLPMPKLYVINDPIPNAFATGRNKNNSVVAATSGLLSILNKNELEGVIAHELSHIQNKDILLQTIIVVMVSTISYLSQIFLRFGAFSDGNNSKKEGGIFVLIGSILAIVLAPIAASVLQLAVSRKREFLADASAAIMTRYPEGLASALTKISQYNQPLAKAKNSTAHLYIVNPMGLNSNLQNDKQPSFFSKLFLTHPPVKDRVEALLNIKL